MAQPLLASASRYSKKVMNSTYYVFMNSQSKPLADDELRDLTEAIHFAHRRQAQALAQAGERALGHIPRLLRVPIRRMLG